jgi:hypothetical protein
MAFQKNSRDPILFFKAACRAYEQVVLDIRYVSERNYRIGPFTVRLCFASNALEVLLTPAVEHLAIPACESPNPDLIIYIWDSDTNQVPMPDCPWDWDECVARGEIPGFGNERIKAAAYADVGLLNMLDLQQNQGIYWISKADRLPYHEQGAPMRNILHWWMRARGLFFLHAGAIGTSRGGVLLAGKSGCGKSTTTLACLKFGWKYLSDDYCLYDSTRLNNCYSLYNSAKLDGTQIQSFPHLLKHIHNPERLEMEKALIFLNQHNPEVLINSFEIKTIFLPRISGKSETVVKPASSIAALRSLAPSTIFQLPGAGDPEFRAISHLVQEVPCYWLDLGTELDAMPKAIAPFMEL